MSGIKDKVVVITGASSGIGEATALLLAERNAKVVLGARGLDRLEALAARITDAGGEAACARTDVRQRDDLAMLVKLACDRYGKLDVLVNNAGIGPISPLDELRVEDWEDMIDVNIKGVCTVSLPRCLCSARRGSGTSSIPLLPRLIGSCRTWRSMPAQRSLCAPSRRACDKRPATSCA